VSLFAELVESGIITLPPDWLAADLLEQDWAGDGFTLRDAESTT
jgi:hypothetical protein